MMRIADRHRRGLPRLRGDLERRDAINHALAVATWRVQLLDAARPVPAELEREHAELGP